MKLKNYSSMLSIAAAFLAATTAAHGQEINIGVSCNGIDYDVNEVARLAVDQGWIDNTYEPHIRENVNFDANSGWAFLGGIDDFSGDLGSPYHKFLLGMMLVMDGVEGPPVPVTEMGGSWRYDDAAFYIGSNHNLAAEYWKLARSDSIQACLDVDPSDGSSMCVDNEPDGWSIWARAYFANVYYGDQEVVRLRGAFDSPNTLANYEGSASFIPDPLSEHGFTTPGYLAHAINYACSSFDDNRGVALVSSTIVHENFHGTSFVGHEDCDRGEGACAKEWDFDAPHSPRIYNGIALNHGTDSYQIEQRFMCDIVEEPADWVPLMVQNVFNSRANDRATENIFQNIIDPIDGSISGRAPLECGVPAARLGSVVLACRAADSCVDASSCALGESCNDGCCVPATCSTAGGTTCSSSADCTNLETCDANSCCVPLACPDGSGNTLCQTSADCRTDEVCLDGCCFRRGV